MPHYTYAHMSNILKLNWGGEREGLVYSDLLLPRVVDCQKKASIRPTWSAMLVMYLSGLYRSLAYE